MPSAGFRKIVLTGVGILLILIGIPLLILPGPGLLLIGAGVAILISQFRRRPTEPPVSGGGSV